MLGARDHCIAFWPDPAWIHVQHASCTGRAGDDKALHGLGVVLVLQHPRLGACELVTAGVAVGNLVMDLKCLRLAFCPCLTRLYTGLWNPQEGLLASLSRGR